MRALLSCVWIIFFGFLATSASAAIDRDLSLERVPMVRHSDDGYLNLSPHLYSLTGEPALDRLKRRVEVHGIITVATAELGNKSGIFSAQLSRLEIAEKQIKAVNPAAATTLLIFASGCLMWLGLYEKRPY